MSSTNSSLGGSGGEAKPLATTSLVPQVHNGAGFVTARADVDTSVADVMLLSDGTRIDTGVVAYPAHGFTIGQYYWLDQTLAGVMTTVKPTTGWAQRLFFVEDADTLIVDVEPAYNVSPVVATQSAVFGQILAAGSINLGDPIPAGARPVVSYTNVSSATGLNVSGTDARMQVNFTTPVPNANYIITGSLRSVNAANWNIDNDMVWTVVSQNTVGFVIAVRELNTGVQALQFDFQVTSPVLAAPANLTTPEVAALVPLDTPVTIDNLRIEARLTGGQGFRLGTVTGTMLINVSAVTSYAADAVFASNRPSVTLTTAMTHPFIWAGQSDADAMTGVVYDRTNNRVYEFTIMTNVAPTLSYIRIKRTM